MINGFQLLDTRELWCLTASRASTALRLSPHQLRCHRERALCLGSGVEARTWALKLGRDTIERVKNLSEQSFAVGEVGMHYCHPEKRSILEGLGMS